MKNLILILLLLSYFNVNAQTQTKEQAVAFINQKLNDVKDIELSTPLNGMIGTIKSVTFSLDTGNRIVYSFKMELKGDDSNHLLVSKFSFNPANIVSFKATDISTKTVNDELVQVNTSYLSVDTKENAIVEETTLNGKTSNNLGHTFTLHFLKKEKTLSEDITKSLFRLRQLYIKN